MAPSDGGLGIAIEKGEKAPHDALTSAAQLQDRAIMRWMGAHALPHFAPPTHRHHRKPPYHWMLGTCPLPPAWMTLKEQFVDHAHALRFISPLRHDAAAMAIVADVVHREAWTTPPGGSDALLKWLAGLLVLSSNVWLILARLPPVASDVGMPDSSLMSTLNGRYGTKFNISKVAEWEGGQWRHGYIPFHKDGTVVAASGMTIATGFDLGQHDKNALKHLGFGPTLIGKLKGFAGKTFEGDSRSSILTMMKATLGPLPELTKEEADEIDRASFPTYVDPTINDWEQGRKSKEAAANLPAFRQLPSAWQTVLLSRRFNAGAWHAEGKPGRPFWTAAIKGDWATAVEKLRSANYKDASLKRRVAEEAALLLTDLPEALPPPNPTPGRPPNPPIWRQ